jgi:hypothetical protein
MTQAADKANSTISNTISDIPILLISLDQVRSKLAWIWLSGSGCIFGLLALQSLLGRFQSSVQEVWGWALPTVLPTLGMILTVLGYTALDPSQNKAEVRIDFYKISLGLSIAYIFLVLMTILIQPMTPFEPIQLMRMANLWLGPTQGLVASVLGVLFVSKRPKRQ